jgi:hypothetical protein
MVKLKKYLVVVEAKNPDDALEQIFQGCEEIITVLPRNVDITEDDAKKMYIKFGNGGLSFSGASVYFWKFEALLNIKVIDSNTIKIG